MKTNLRNKIISIFLMFTMLIGIFATLPLTAFAASSGTLTEYGITIADSNDNGVMISSENCADVLGDGTVSFDPATNTLTLNGYVYEGDGFQSGTSASRYGIMVYDSVSPLTIELKGENKIALTNSNSYAVYAFNTDVVMKGGGSLTVNSKYFGFYVNGSNTCSFEIQGGNITVNAPYAVKVGRGDVKMNGGTLAIIASGSSAEAVNAYYDFIMTGGSLNINTENMGIQVGGSGTLPISGGTLEISTKNAGHAFTHFAGGSEYSPTVPTVTGDYKMTASVNEDGNGAVIFNNANVATYKYVKIVTEYGITIANSQNNGVMINSENCADVLDDGTVSYDTAAKKLILNGYKYEGEGFQGGWKYGFEVSDSVSALTIELKGKNEITLTHDNAWAISAYNTDVIIMGGGSLAVTSKFYGINAGSLEIQGGDIAVNASPAIIAVNDFKMTGGSLKINTDREGISVREPDSAFAISNGMLEISAKEAGYAFMRYDEGADKYLPTIPTVIGNYRMTASVNEDGSGPVTFDDENYDTYKYVKIEVPHIHDYGTTWENGESEHWNECECGDKANVAPHADTNNDEKCDACGYAMPKAEENDPSAPTPELPDTNTEKDDEITDSQENKKDETDAKAKGGCGSSVALSAFAIVGIIGATFVIKKKED